ncbi:type II toxin-antitoxin system VapC family toxin [Stanieria cyanosphaera]|uniref:type II toxin-antitoxin system VapC family toxin n=1 Tax=Stanieria cyanosphaera TaxID=102116 RepID=UPI001C0A8115|nr:PIN domain-containing protein [Stanieria cyanosphaera]
MSTWRSLRQRMLTTWCCYTEAMYFAGRLGGWLAQEYLWRLAETNALDVHSPTPNEQARMRSLMKKYQNVPMDLADASLVALAETRGISTIFTLDKDFFIYRWNDTNVFNVVPDLRT